MKTFIPTTLILMMFAVISTPPVSSMERYQLNDTDLNEILGEQSLGTIKASSGNEDDTALLEFDQKNIRIHWATLQLDAEGKNDLGKSRLESGRGVMKVNTFNGGEYEDNCGFLGNPECDHVQIIGTKLSFNQTSLGFKEAATICAQENTSSIIRGLSFTKKAGTNFPLILGMIDFTRKDGIFSGTDLPCFAISGIETLSLTFDKGKF